MPGMDAPASERIDAPKRTLFVTPLPLFTMDDLRQLEQRVKTDCYKSHRIELRRVRRKCYAALGGVLMAGWLLGLVFSAAVVCLFPL